MGYDSVPVPAGRTVRVSFPLNDRSFATWSQRRLEVLAGCYRLAAGASSRELPSSATVGRGTRCAGQGLRLGTSGSFFLPLPPTPTSHLLPAPKINCARAGGTLTPTSLEGLRLGLVRARARKLFGHLVLREGRYLDFFCSGAQGIRAGYPSPRLLRTLSASAQRRIRGKVALILTDSRRFRLRGVRPGARLSAVAKRVHLIGPITVGANQWYLLNSGSGRGVLQVRHGVVLEIGIAVAALTRSRSQDVTFLNSFS